MKKERAIEIGFTHEGFFMGFIPVFYEKSTMTLAGKNIIFDWLVLNLGKLQSDLFPNSEFYISNSKDI